MGVGIRNTQFLHVIIFNVYIVVANLILPLLRLFRQLSKFLIQNPVGIIRIPLKYNLFILLHILRHLQCLSNTRQITCHAEAAILTTLYRQPTVLFIIYHSNIFHGKTQVRRIRSIRLGYLPLIVDYEHTN